MDPKSDGAEMADGDNRVLSPVLWPPRYPDGTPIPGSGTSILRHPSGRDVAVEVAVFKEHRFAFAFWAGWTRARRRKGLRPPHLVSLDFHQDLCWPADCELADLDGLNLQSDADVALFAWARLNPLNHDHIFSAAYLDLIQDIFVLSKTDDDSYLEVVTDVAGKTHRVVVCYSLEELLEALPHSADVYLDIDLDFFTEQGPETSAMLVDDSDVTELMAPGSPLMRAVLPGLAGMTIATEPEYCGGLRGSNHLYGLLDSALFNPPLLSDDADWAWPR